ncbi:MAG: hypothetical protein IPK52_21165 [Chloroflexi bacterium]|nr:hypothetical protein [Chloroflexota bacterium]
MGDETINDRVTFSFGTGVNDEGSPALQAIKLWQEDGADREARRTIDVFGMSDEAEIIARELNNMLRKDGLNETMRLAEDIAPRKRAAPAGQRAPVCRRAAGSLYGGCRAGLTGRTALPRRVRRGILPDRWSHSIQASITPSIWSNPIHVLWN